MPRKQSLTKIYIEEALFLLLEEQDIDDITISELVDKAGVSRNSFYRNFTEIEDVALSYYRREFTKWWESDGKDVVNNPYKYYFSLFKFLKSHKEQLICVFKRQYQVPLFKLIYDEFLDKDPIKSVESMYQQAANAGIFCSFLSLWIHRGMVDELEDMVKYHKSFFDSIYSTAKEYYKNNPENE